MKVPDFQLTFGHGSGERLETKSLREIWRNLVHLHAVVESPDFLLTFGHGDAEGLVTKS